MYRPASPTDLDTPLASYYTHPILSPQPRVLQPVLEDQPSPLSAGRRAGTPSVDRTPRSENSAQWDHSQTETLRSDEDSLDTYTSPSSLSPGQLVTSKRRAMTSSFSSSTTSTTTRIPKASRAHSKSGRSCDIPRQTIMKALASRSRSRSRASSTANPPIASPTVLLSNVEGGKEQNSQKFQDLSSQKLCAALSNLQSSYTERPAPPSRLPLPSPCFLHKRLDEAVNIDDVLQEIADDESMSPSRLAYTASGVREWSKKLQRRPLKRVVRNVMIITKARDNRLVHLTRELAEWLLTKARYGRDIGVNVYVDDKLRKSSRFDAPGLVQKNPRFQDMLKYWTPNLCWDFPEKFDLVLTLGGDGTVLFTSWLFQRIVPPVLSFALGSLGFLTNFAFENYAEHLDRVMDDVGMHVNLRMRFTCTIWRVDRSPEAERGAVVEGEQFEVLNELVIDRGPSPYVSNLELFGDNELLTVVQADGCIFSTPTGSTAYSLSAGGSLIHPSIPGILLTPICPHTLSFRPMVLSDSIALKIAIPTGSRSTAYCSFDGKGRVELKQGDFVTLEASQYPLPTVMASRNEWTESVQRALRWNVRGAVQQAWGADDPGEDAGEEGGWDIDIDVPSTNKETDSGIGHSEDGGSGATSTNGTGSPRKRPMSLLDI